jgi:GT2 family glycosyltransferase
MSKQQPLVTVGLPVFNGGGTVGGTIASLLAQDYPHLEVLISDNASTDDTQEVCQAFAERDRRVRYHRQPRKLGMGSNWQWVSRQSSGAYFMWATHDDQWSPNLLTALVNALEDERDAALAFPTNHFASVGGESVVDCGQLANLAGPLPLVQRVNHVLWFEEGAQKGNLIYGLMRAEALRRIGYPPLDHGGYGVWGGDQLTVFALAFQGYFVYVPEAHFYKRYFPDRKYDADDLLEHLRDMHGYFSRCRQVIVTSQLELPSQDVLLASLAARETTWYCRVLAAKNTDEFRARLGTIIEHCDRGRESAPDKLPAQPAMSQRPLTSIVILNYNGSEHLRLCLDSIRRQTPELHEVIVFDNASTDGSRDYLRTHPDIVLAESPVNLGCPPGRAQAIALAKGDFVVFLDNDTVVTPTWLRTFLDHAASDPKIGILGPRSNHVSGAQLVPAASYANAFEMNQFAKLWSWVARRHPTLIPTHRLVGFCMFIRREVIDRIGGPDSRFGKFGFEDDDFALRALIAGFKVMIANDVFIHHTGGPQGSGNPEYNRQLVEAWDIYKEKWDIPADILCGQPYDVAKACAQPFDPQRHYVPIPPASLVRQLVYCPTRLAVGDLDRLDFGMTAEAY